MFRRRRLVAGALAGVVALSLVFGVSRLFGGSTTGVVDGAAAPTDGATPAASASVRESVFSTSGEAAGSSTGTAQATTPSTTPSTVTTPPSPTKQRPETAVPNGAGKFTVFAVPRPDSTGGGRVVSYTVEVEHGLRADGKALAAAVQVVLQAPHGWQRVDTVRFVHLDQAQVKAGKKPDVVVTFASPGTVDKLCVPLSTQGRTSCASTPRAVLNYWRWVNGVEFYGTNLGAYRQYMVNHEVGHLLGHLHEKCPAKGTPAPIMSQQTLGLDGCTPNAWPVASAKA